MGLCNWVKKSTEATALTVKKTINPPNKAIHSEEDRWIMTFPKDWFETALRITGQFEGRGFDQVTGNFDGMGISCGILQWNFGMGSLQNKILTPAINKLGSDFVDNFFPSKVSHYSVMSSTIAMINCKKTMLVGTSLRPEWKEAWAVFMRHPEVIEIQKKACYGVAESAAKIMRSWNMNSTRSFCFFFDVVTQNGSMKGLTPSLPTSTETATVIVNAGKNTHLWRSSNLTTEQEVLLWAAYRRAKKSNQRWFDDVLSRKGTIAVGRGVVHGQTLDLNQELA